MILHIEFPNNYTTMNLMQQIKIPCLIQVSNNFYVKFDVTNPSVTGVMTEWEPLLFEERAVARAGGEFIYEEPALITLHEIGDNLYKVHDLFVFYNDFGWCAVIDNGEYATPHPFWDNNDDDPDYQG